jgi:serine/threonine protein kinase
MPTVSNLNGGLFPIKIDDPLMDRIRDFNLIEKLGETEVSVVYRAQNPKAGKTVILKMLKSRFPTSADIARLKHEYDIIRQKENIIRTQDMFSHENGFVLVLEDFQGISIKLNVLIFILF